MRGIPQVDTSKCYACGACAVACPVDAITVTYGEERAIIRINYRRCIRCAYCRDNCPAGAIVISEKYGIVSSSIEDLYGTFEVVLAKCEQCTIGLKHSTNAEKIAREKTVVKLLCDKCRRELVSRNLTWVR